MRKFAVIFGIGILFLFTLSGGATTPSGPLQIVGVSFGATFVPPVLQAARGETISFQNQDFLFSHNFSTGLAGGAFSGSICKSLVFNPVSHTYVEGPAIACDIDVFPTVTTSFTISNFATPGNYGFHCRIHPNINGVIQIT